MGRQKQEMDRTDNSSESILNRKLRNRRRNAITMDSRYDVMEEMKRLLLGILVIWLIVTFFPIALLLFGIYVVYKLGQLVWYLIFDE